MRQGLWLTFILVLLVTLIVISHTQSPPAETVPNAGAGAPARAAGNLELLSDTKGVDFNPYLSKLLQKVRANWYNVIPEEARPPQLAAGVTSIEFAILKTGDVRGTRPSVRIGEFGSRVLGRHRRMRSLRSTPAAIRRRVSRPSDALLPQSEELTAKPTTGSPAGEFAREKVPATLNRRSLGGFVSVHLE